VKQRDTHFVLVSGIYFSELFVALFHLPPLSKHLSDLEKFDNVIKSRVANTANVIAAGMSLTNP
jgi:hypothetical protein